MAKRSWTGDRALQIAKAVLNGEITPTMDILTPAHILEVANAAVKSKGYAEYADFADDLFLEILAGRPPYEVGWRLNEPRNVLRANLWTDEGRPTKFFPPQH
jgi:nitric oxide synthase oxygenase domain/subunit